jgi:amino acid adenylation domain-containing protein
MNDRNNFLSKLRELNITLQLDEDGGLDVESPKGVLTPEIIGQIRDRKAELVDYLRQSKNNIVYWEDIPEAAAAASYPMSSSQMRLWIISEIDRDSLAYNISNVVELTGTPDPVRYEFAIRAVIGRHEILRTVFRPEGGGSPRQWILKDEDAKFSLEYFDLEKEENGQEEANRLIWKDTHKPFDLNQWPLFRIMLFWLGNEKYIFYYNMHHIISDGWSMNILIRDVLAYYESYPNKEAADLPLLRIQYKDYAAWQQEQLRAKRLMIHREYWLEQLGGELPVLDLPADMARPSVLTDHGYGVSTVIGKDLVDAFQSLCQRGNATLFMGLLGVLNVLLYRYTGQEDIIIGSPVAGREHVELADQIGFYLNTLALRTRFSGEDSYEMLLDRVREMTMAAHEHQMYPFDKLVEDLPVERGNGHSPLFDVLMVLQNQQDPRYAGKINLVSDEQISDEGEHAVKFDLSFDFVDKEGALFLEVVFNTDIFRKERVVGMVRHYKQLLSAIVSAPGMAIRQIEYLSDEEKRQLLEELNDTDVDYPRDGTIVDHFEEQAMRTPDNIAVVCEGNTLSYRELDERSNQLGHYLRRKGVKEETLVPVLLERSVEMIISILGILKAGGAYVPLDPEYPKQRIAAMLADTAAGLIVTHSRLAGLLEEAGAVETVCLDTDNEAIGRENRGRVQSGIGPGSLAYIIYTSGSTGMPKGVMIEHGSVINLVLGLRATIYCRYLHETLRIALVAPFAFDSSVKQIYSALLNGHSLYIVPGDIRLSGDSLWRYYDDNKIDVTDGTASLLTILVNEMPSAAPNVRHFIIGGEVLPADLTRRLYYNGPGRPLISNVYGTTETCVDSSIYTVEGEERPGVVPIGKPMINTRIYILNNEGEPVPKGVVGELCVSGAGVARGYLKREELTAQRFVPNPYREGERMYRTGDMARWLEDGNIEFAGRMDDQVKIRGYRIELGEVEQAIRRLERIDKVAVVARTVGESGGRSLVAYIVSGEVQDAGDLRSRLSKQLPEYMIPGYFVQLDELPMTTSGKIDRKNLPSPEEAGLSTGREYVAPRNNTEKKIVELVASAIGIDSGKIGIEDRFFELGGNSMTMIKIAGLINIEFNKNIKTVSLFQYPTVRSLVDNYFSTENHLGTNGKLLPGEESPDEAIALFEKF